MQQSSAEHVRVCLLGMHAAFGRPLDDQHKIVMRRYEAELVKREPVAIRRACEDLALSEERFPPLSKVLRAVFGYENGRQPRLAAPSADGPPPKPKGTPAEVRETARLVELVRANPGVYAAPDILIRWGERLICDALAEGRAPPDVVERYLGPMVAA